MALGMWSLDFGTFEALVLWKLTCSCTLVQSSLAKRRQIGSCWSLCLGCCVPIRCTDDVSSRDSKGGDGGRLCFVIVRESVALSFLFASSMSRSPRVRIDGALERSRAVPTIRVAELIICHHYRVDQVEKFGRVRTVESSLVCSSGDCCAFASDGRLWQG